MLAPSPGRLVPPPTGNPGTAPVKVEWKSSNVAKLSLI